MKRFEVSTYNFWYIAEYNHKQAIIRRVQVSYQTADLWRLYYNTTTRMITVDFRALHRGQEIFEALVQAHSAGWLKGYIACRNSHEVSAALSRSIRETARYLTLTGNSPLAKRVLEYDVRVEPRPERDA
jgi:hypothetical protein